jgi:hypothetical protein
MLEWKKIDEIWILFLEVTLTESSSSRFQPIKILLALAAAKEKHDELTAAEKLDQSIINHYSTTKTSNHWVKKDPTNIHTMIMKKL